MFWLLSGKVSTVLTAQLLKPRVFVLVGDGELDEGSNHEAIAYAGRAGLDTLNVIAVDNASSSHGWPGGRSTLVWQMLCSCGQHLRMRTRSCDPLCSVGLGHSNC